MGQKSSAKILVRKQLSERKTQQVFVLKNNNTFLSIIFISLIQRNMYLLTAFNNGVTYFYLKCNLPFVIWLFIPNRLILSVNCLGPPWVLVLLELWLFLGSWFSLGSWDLPEFWILPGFWVFLVSLALLGPCLFSESCVPFL